MKRSLFILAAFFLSLIASSVVQAQPSTTIPSEQPSLLKGVRQLGMGNAGIAMPARDVYGPFYNPASVNDFEKKFHFAFVEPTVDFSPGAIGLVTDVIDLVDDIDDAATTGAKINVFRTFVNARVGRFESVQVRLPLLQVQHKWFHVTLLADSRNTVSFRNRAFTNFEVFSRSDFGGVIGGAWSFFPDESIDGDILQVGANIKILHRLSIDEILTTDDVINNTNFDDALPRRRATGVGGDIGIKAHIPTFGIGVLNLLKPTVGLTWQDIANTGFTDPIKDTEQSLSVGFALHPNFGAEDQYQVHFALDIRGMNQSRTFAKMLNLGAEFQLPQYWGFFTPSVRIGGNQLYLTAGATLDFKYGKLEVATYGEEAAKFSRQREIRRIAFSLGFRI